MTAQIGKAVIFEHFSNKNQINRLLVLDIIIVKKIDEDDHP